MEVSLKITTKKTFLTSEEMAAKLRISIRKLQQMVKDGTAPKHVKFGSRLVFVIDGEASHE